jgi:PadR family transcriptional regulator, regulatory protein PadR
MRSERVKGHLDLVLLGVLADGPDHGYAVISALRERSGGVIDLQEGSVYPALHRLEDQGLLASDWEPVGGRRRRIYHLTARGAEALDGERGEWERLADAIDTIVRPAAARRGLAEGVA